MYIYIYMYTIHIYIYIYYRIGINIVHRKRTHDFDSRNFESRVLRSRIQIYSESVVDQRLSKETHACENSKPQGLEDDLKHELLNTDRIRRVSSLLKLFTLLDLCVSSLRRGHANLLCIAPILADDPRRESQLRGRDHTHPSDNLNRERWQTFPKRREHIVTTAV